MIPIYFDIATPARHPKTMAQPLLKKVFEGEQDYVAVMKVEVMVPSTKVLVEMKLTSVSQRDDRFKKSKDIADLFSLLRYDDSLWEHDEEGNRVHSIEQINPTKFKEDMSTFIADGNITDAASMLKMDVETITNTLNQM